jgi:hypothetical protein
MPVEGGEYMMRRVVAQANLPFLEALNSGMPLGAALAVAGGGDSGLHVDGGFHAHVHAPAGNYPDMETAGHHLERVMRRRGR